MSVYFLYIYIYIYIYVSTYVVYVYVYIYIYVYKDDYPNYCRSLDACPDAFPMHTPTHTPMQWSGLRSGHIVTPQNLALTPWEKRLPEFLPKFFPLGVAVRFRAILAGNITLRPYGQQLLKLFCSRDRKSCCRRTLGSDPTRRSCS